MPEGVAPLDKLDEDDWAALDAEFMDMRVVCCDVDEAKTVLDCAAVDEPPSNAVVAGVTAFKATGTAAVVDGEEVEGALAIVLYDMLLV